MFDRPDHSRYAVEMENASTPELFLPSTQRRGIALMIDGLILVPTTLGVMALLGAKITMTEMSIPWAAIMWSTALNFGFQFFMLKKYSATPGKMAMRLIIVDPATMNPSLSSRQSFLRVLCGFLSYSFSLAPQSVALFRLDRRAVSDLIAHTRVMQKIPRTHPPKKRWIVGSILIAYFVVTGLFGVWNTARTSELTSRGWEISTTLPTTLPGAPLQPAEQHE